MTDAQMCESILDRHNHWNRTLDKNILTKKPQIANYTQNCTVWSIDFRRNETDCPALIRPDCFIMNAPNANFGCPFGTSDGSGGSTNEFCECVGLTRERMNISHPFNCTCTRNLYKHAQKIKNTYQCYDYFLFQKTCVIHWPYEVNLTNKTTKQNYTVTRYRFNCTFVNCYEVQDEELIRLTRLNGTCSNETITTTTTTTTITTTTPKTTTTLKTALKITPTITKTATTSTTTSQNHPSTTEIKTSVITERSLENTSPTIINPSTSTEQKFTSDVLSSSAYSNFKASERNILNGLNNPISQFEVSSGKIEYSKQANQGSLFGIMIFMAVVQISFIFGIGFLAKKQRARNLMKQLQERSIRE